MVCSYIIGWFQKQKVVCYFISFLGIILLTLFIRLFLFEIYSIPSGSMANTLFPGDKVVVCKINYGAKLPRSPFEIPWLNVLFYLNKKARTKADTTWWKYRRLPGFSEINRGDIIVFQFPGNNNEAFIKRCAALPGDTFLIINSDVYINNRLQPLPVESKQLYRVWYSNFNNFKIITDSLNIPVYEWFTKKDSSFRVINLTSNQKKKISGITCIDSITCFIKFTEYLTNYYLWHDPYLWTPVDMGPFIIPGKECKIKPDKDNIILYKKVLERFENVSITNDNGEWEVNGSVVIDYKFKQDYYFMLGDNRNASNDSRYWGFVPEDHIIGKACFVLFSLNPNKKGLRKIRWDRMFRKIK